MINQNYRRPGPTRAQWMAKFESEVLAREPKYAGKVDWNTAQHYFNNEINPADAAARYVSVPR